MTQYCEDHNECMFDTHECDQEAHCNNTDGSYDCYGFSTILRNFRFRKQLTHRNKSIGRNFRAANNKAKESTCMEGYIGNGWMCSIPDSWNDLNYVAHRISIPGGVASVFSKRYQDTCNWYLRTFEILESHNITCDGNSTCWLDIDEPEGYECRCDEMFEKDENDKCVSSLKCAKNPCSDENSICQLGIQIDDNVIDEPDRKSGWIPDHG